MRPPSWTTRDEEHVDSDFSGRVFGSVLAYGGTFTRCDFSDTSFESFSAGHETTTRFVDCRFRRTRFPLRNTHLFDVRLERCVFDGARIRDMRFSTVDVVDCVFRGRVWHTIFYGVPPTNFDKQRRSRNEFHANDFSEAELVDVEFRDIDLGAQRWSLDQREYALVDRIDERVQAALAQAEDWPDAAVSSLESWRARRRDPHGRLLLRRPELAPHLSPSLRDRLWAVLVTDYNDAKL